MAWDTMSKGAAEGDKFLKEMQMRALQIASSNAQADQRAQIDRERMAQQERMQQERLAAEGAEREEARGLRREELGAQRDEREAQMVERQRQFDLSRQDRLGQQQVDNERRATLDDWKMRLDEQQMAANDARLAEMQERVAALQRQNDDAIRQAEEKRRLYEDVPMTALVSALNTKKPDGTSMGCNLPAANAEIARQLGLKGVEYSGFDENGVFAIKGLDESGKPFIKQYSPEWVQSACDYFYGKDNPFSASVAQRQKSERSLEDYRQRKAIDDESYEKHKGEQNLQSVLRSLAGEVGKGNMTDAEADAAAKWYTGFLEAQKKAQTPTPAPAPTGKPQGGQGQPAPQNGDEDRRAALQRRLAEIEAQKGGQGGGRRNIPGMPRRQGEQPNPAPQGGEGEPQGQQTQRQPVGRTRSERAQQFADAGLTAQSVAKEYGIDEGKAEAAINRAKGKYLRGETGGQSLESVLLGEIAWQQRISERKPARGGRRSRRGDQ